LPVATLPVAVSISSTMSRVSKDAPPSDSAQLPEMS
jgi:hypothetical protein